MAASGLAARPERMPPDQPTESRFPALRPLELCESPPRCEPAYRFRPLAAGWLMEVGWPGGARQRWIARVGNWASEPLPLDEAKRAAVAMLRERKETEPRDWIEELNKIAATEAHRRWLMQARKQWPGDLVGAASHPRSMQIDRKLRDAILSAELVAMPSHAEPLSGEGIRIEFDQGGYPKLPECLRRRARYGR